MMQFAGIDYVTTMKQRGVNVVLSNNSWGGGGYFASLLSAIDRARAAGILFVAAAGNESNNNDQNPSYPASYQLANIISVAALDSSGALASFSNYGATSVHIGAPGVSIASTYFDGGYRYLSGTSMATPHVSGAIALLAGYAPYLGWQELKDAVLRSGKPVGSLTNTTSTGKMIDAYALVVNPDQFRGPGNPRGPTPTPTSTPTRTPTPLPTNTPTPAPTPTPAFYDVSGQVTAGGIPLAQALVRIEVPSIGYAQTIYTGPSGTYRINDIPGLQSFTVRVSKAGYSFSDVGGVLLNDQTVNFVAVENTYVVGGLVLRPDNTPISGVTVSAGAFGSVVTNAQGAFSFRLPFGVTYELAASKTGSYISSKFADRQSGG